MTTYLMHFNDSIDPSHYPFWNYGAIGKWRKDFETFAGEQGVELIRGFAYSWPEEPEDVLSSRLDGLLGGLKRHDIVIVHWAFPNPDPRWVHKFADRIHAFGAKLVYMISDIESWRFEHSFEEHAKDAPFYERMRKEAELLSLADGLILHSPAMKEKLLHQFEMMGYDYSGPVSFIGPSGYRTQYFGPKRQFSKSIDYAGSLEKAQFLTHLPADYQITVFGVTEENLKNFRNKSSVRNLDRVDPEAIPHILKSSFGLVWDSDSYPRVTGWFGEYMRVTSPGKFNLYLAANQPVILWSQSPLAGFVQENNIGIVIDDLSQLPEKLNDMTEEKYDQMLQDVQRISGLIRNGSYLKKAISDIELLLLDNSFSSV